MQKIEFFFEFASTYSYLSVMRIEKLIQNSSIEILWRPFLLGPIFKEQGWNDSPFNVYPAKGKYMWKDMQRRSRKYGIDFLIPNVFPRNGLLASRIAIANETQPWISSFIRETFQANFAQDQDISSRDVLTPILKKIGVNSEEILQGTSNEEIKNRLRKQTERAASLGIFGAPSFIVNEELFWGDDRLEDALEELRR
ncbi:2-hydroxychromene-2-carboxylate isomerase [Leptospira adleri]|uniref:2-hydroxychromene-2-carboxylate isomerase n=1 Tax=Leptospira adleri TaxID=2023186 RepID=A0A2M9YQ42_9LEPT|nr:2-hydroxychromene-2-carboxylate isomerase [Leptospira adleri]PJZ53642.1 2-hydroxychromene-2-carboxylate isomerase [Leptospira adleri]PJZ60712.1 2-hydroxychromene-2-carboxylate isomerase [Leptospira adleri]